MTFGAETTEQDARAQLDLYVERGGTLVDTADVYADGESERIVGRWLRDRRDQPSPVIATKGRFRPPAGSYGASRRALVTAVDGSLTRLGVEALDLYYVHAWDRHTPLEETLDTLSGLVRQGKIHSLGWSNLTGWQLQKVLSTARLGGHVVPVALQPQYNLLDRSVEWEVLPCALEEGLGVLPWSPLGGGWLAGKYARDQRPTGATRLGEDPGRGVEAYDVRNTDRTWRILDVVAELAARLDRPMAHVALAWLRDRPGVASVLLGARTVEQLRSNLDAADLVLDAADTAALTAVSAPGLPAYPYALLEDMGEVDHWKRLGVGSGGA
ncbi:aldo/keto reductase [Nocardioides mesophilus]|uniref:Aldo/keto reductase n=2 Tax=Nocardioides mesophilus TaxID=433659 RepID=A0A7G9RHV7_9ACTN|nr:aldo/keto reductase [Nocardioides mesophilus]